MPVFDKASMRLVKIVLISIITFAFSNALEDVEEVTSSPSPLEYSEVEEVTPTPCLALAETTKTACDSDCDIKHRGSENFINHFSCSNLCQVEYIASKEICNPAPLPLNGLENQKERPLPSPSPLTVEKCLGLADTSKTACSSDCNNKYQGKKNYINNLNCNRRCLTQYAAQTTICDSITPPPLNNSEPQQEVAPTPLPPLDTEECLALAETTKTACRTDCNENHQGRGSFANHYTCDNLCLEKYKKKKKICDGTPPTTKTPAQLPELEHNQGYQTVEKCKQNAGQTYKVCMARCGKDCDDSECWRTYTSKVNDCETDCLDAAKKKFKCKTRKNKRDRKKCKQDRKAAKARCRENYMNQ